MSDSDIGASAAERPGSDTGPAATTSRHAKRNFRPGQLNVLARRGLSPGIDSRRRFFSDPCCREKDPAEDPEFSTFSLGKQVMHRLGPTLSLDECPHEQHSPNKDVGVLGNQKWWSHHSDAPPRVQVNFGEVCPGDNDKDNNLNAPKEHCNPQVG